MSEPIIGVTVGTPMNPNKLVEKTGVTYTVPYYSPSTITDAQKEEIRGIITEIAAEKADYALFMKISTGIIPASYIEDSRSKTVRATLHDLNNLIYQIVLSKAGEVTVSQETIYVMDQDKIESATSKAPTGAAMASYVQDYVAQHGENVSAEELAAAIEAYFEENPIVTEETDPTVYQWAKEPTKPTYTASEVGALPANTEIPVKTSELENDSGFLDKIPDEYVTEDELNKKGYLTQHQDLSSYAKKDELPTVPTKLSAFENDKGYLTKAPVTSVNGKTGAVSLSASDVKALPDTYTPPDQTAAQVGADPKGTADSKVTAHNTSNASHNDIRLLIEGLTTRLNTLADSTDEDLDQLSEIVAYIKANKELIEGVTTNKVSVSDIIDNLTTNVANKPLSAAQGVALKALIDAITVPTKLSQLSGDATHRTVTDTEKAAWNAKSDFSGNYADLSGQPTIPAVPSKVSAFENDAGYLKSFTETDPTVPSWAKQSTKPSYTKSEVGLGNVENVKQYSASNPPPYPVTSVNGKTGAVTVSVPTKTSQLTNDSGFLTAHQDISGKADKSNAETWTFTLKSGSTVTKKVVLA